MFCICSRSRVESIFRPAPPKWPQIVRAAPFRSAGSSTGCQISLSLENPAWPKGATASECSMSAATAPMRNAILNGKAVREGPHLGIYYLRGSSCDDHSVWPLSVNLDPGVTVFEGLFDDP